MYSPVSLLDERAFQMQQITDDGRFETTAFHASDSEARYQFRVAKLPNLGRTLIASRYKSQETPTMSGNMRDREKSHANARDLQPATRAPPRPHLLYRLVEPYLWGRNECSFATMCVHPYETFYSFLPQRGPIFFVGG